jgi:hypothetical protein
VRQWNQSRASIANTISNNISCECSNRGSCQLIVDYEIDAPANADMDTKYIAYYTANVVAAVEAPFAYEQPDKNDISLPKGMTMVTRLYYESTNKPIGIVAVVASSIYVIFRGTATHKEWTEDINFGQTSSISDTNKSSSKMDGFFGSLMDNVGKKETVTSQCTSCNQRKDKKTQSTTNTIIGQAMVSELYGSDDSVNADLGQVHQGFSNIYNTLRDTIYDAIKVAAKQINAEYLIFGGHSLGAAIATLAYSDNRNTSQVTNSYCYTFGGPRVGNVTYANYVSSLGNYHRIVNLADVITDLPFSVMPNFDQREQVLIYKHAGEPYEQFQANKTSLLENHSMRTYLDELRVTK